MLRSKNWLAGAFALLMAGFGTSQASAATINGAIDIGGQVTVASTQSLTSVDFIQDGRIIAAVGDFGSIDPNAAVTLTDIDFTMPGVIWSVGGFAFEALSFSSIDANNQGGKDFTATGFFSGPGFDDTTGTFEFSSQTSGVLASFSSSSLATGVSAVPLPAGLPLLIGALGLMGVVRSRKKRAA